jgi:predicted TIM-barrel fold metal-dependent hydrolase
MERTADRRQFLKNTALALAGAGSASVLLTTPQETQAAPSKAKTMLPIVDTHQHLWDLTRFKLPWIKKGSPLAKSFVMKDYRAATAGLNVVKAVYMEVDLDPKQQLAEAEFVIELCKKNKTPTRAAVISGRPAAPDFKKYVGRFKGSPYIKGLRQVLHVKSTPAGFCLQEQFVKGVQLLGEMGLSYDLCLRAGELLDGKKLIGKCPDTRFILDHCGNANVQARDRTQWQKDMAALARCKNLVCKVSGIVVSARPGKWSAADLAPIVNHTLDVFGPDRVMFGGDWPVCTLAATYKQWVEALRSIVQERKEAEQKKLFHDNAVKFYGLK